MSGLDAAPLWAVIALVAVLVMIAGEAGYRLGERSKDKPGSETPDELVVAAAFTLVALLLGFTFSMAFERFDARRIAVVHEASAIKTIAERSSLLDAASASAVREELRRYTDARLAFLQSHDGDGDAARAMERSDAHAAAMARIAIDAAHKEPFRTTATALLQSIDAANDVADEEGALVTFYVPRSIMLMLVAITLISTGLMTYRGARLGQRGLIAGATIAVMVALAIGIVLDLGAPQRGGLINVSLEPMRAARQSIAP